MKLGRKQLENNAVKNLRDIGEKNGVTFKGVPDNTLKFLISRGKQARFWNKQFAKGRISQETLNKRLDLIRQDLAPVLSAIAKQQPKPAQPKPTTEIVPTAQAPAEPTVAPVTPTVTPIVTPAPAEITTPDQSLLDERRGIGAIPQAQRTPQQIERLGEIETELIDRNIEKFPVQDITDKARKAELKKVETEIKENPAFELIAEGAEAVPELGGVFNVDSTEIGDVRARFDGQPELLKKFKLVEQGGRRWDTIADEREIEGGLDAFMDAVELFVESEAGLEGIPQAFLDEALAVDVPDLEMLALKRDLINEGETATIINEELNTLAERLDIPPEDRQRFLMPVEGVTEAERRAQVLKEVTREKPKKPVKKPEQEAIKKAQARAFKEKTPIFVVEKDGKFSVTQKRPTKGEFVRITAAEPGQLLGKTERLVAGPTAEEVAEAKKLKQQINIVAKSKGLTETRFNQIKMDNADTKRLTKMTVEELRDVLKGVKRARPKKIRVGKSTLTVVTPKTERQIASLKESLTNAELMNEAEWDNILAEETGGKQPKYISEKAFITQTQGRKVLSHMHDVAEKLRATESFRLAVEADPEILTAQVKDTSSELTEEDFLTKAPIEIRSMRKYIQKLEERLGAPIYHIFQDITFTHQVLTKERRQLLNSLEEMPGFIKIAKSPTKIQRVSDFIASQSTLKDKPEKPTDITPEEEAIAKRIQGIFKSYQLQARIGKFFQHLDNLSSTDIDVRSRMPQYRQFKQEIDRALEIYDTEGFDALVDYLRTQKWGTVGSGYEPMESVIRKVSTHRLPDIAVGKTHVKERGIQYVRQERNILQRLESYIRQMDFLSFMQPKIKALVREVNENLSRFNEDDSRNVSAVISVYLDNLKKTNNEDGWTERNMRPIYAQAITTLVLADPIVKPVRNLLQNAALSEDRRDFIKLGVRFAKRGEILSEQDTEFLETFVHQDRVMLSDWAFTGEDPIDFLFHKRAVKALTGWDVPSLTKWVQRHTLYPASDRVNRTMSFSAKLWRVKDAWAKDQSLAAKEKEARFSDMQWGERQLARGILARDGVEAMARFIAKVHTDNTHFLYAREQRSPAEQTKVGKMIWNLALFKRAALEKAAEQLHKVIEKDTSFANRLRAARVLVSLVAAATIINII
ncbi:hypothetical protein LCGC14_0866320, partial [marine sediment metagenome]